jgi:hypothetical protein
MTVENYSPSGLHRADAPVIDWPSIRIWILDRDKRICQICHIRPATDVDHIWPRRLGGTDHVSNLRAACGPCNKTKGDRVDVATATGLQLISAVAALDARIGALRQERRAFENELMVRVAHDTAQTRDHIQVRYHAARAAQLAADLEASFWGKPRSGFNPAIADIPTDPDGMWLLPDGHRIRPEWATRMDVLSWFGLHHDDEGIKKVVCELLEHMPDDKILVGEAAVTRRRVLAASNGASA